MDVTADRTDTRDHAAARPLSKVASTAFRTNRRGRRISVAGAVYIASWVAGLVLAPTTPVATASPDEIHRYYADEAPANRRAVLAHPRGRRPRARRARPHRPRRDRRLPALARVIRTSGVAAAVVSLLQVAFAVVGVATADSAAASTSARLFDDLNLADTAKLVLIAVFAASATTAAASAGMTGRWTRLLTAALPAIEGHTVNLGTGSADVTSLAEQAQSLITEDPQPQLVLIAS